MIVYVDEYLIIFLIDKKTFLSLPNYRNLSRILVVHCDHYHHQFADIRVILLQPRSEQLVSNKIQLCKQ